VTTHVTHCALRLGDNMAHVHFLRKLAAAYPDHRFEHYAHAAYVPELLPMVVDEPRIKLKTLPVPGSAASSWGKNGWNSGDYWHARPPVPSIDAWKNTGDRFERADPARRQDYAGFMLDWFHELARQMKLESPLGSTRDLLFDYPELHQKPKADAKPVDFLIVNSAPLSGQAPHYRGDHMEELIMDLQRAGFSIVATARSGMGFKYPCTQDWGWNCTMIGRASQACRRIIMVATGPSWPTFNIWNRKSVELRIIINETERVELDPRAILAASVDGVRSVLNAKAIL
jgi:hypothetical protein